MTPNELMRQADELFLAGDPKAAVEAAQQAEEKARRGGMKQAEATAYARKAEYGIVFLNSWQCKSAVSADAVKYRNKREAAMAAEKQEKGAEEKRKVSAARSRKAREAKQEATEKTTKAAKKGSDKAATKKAASPKKERKAAGPRPKLPSTTLGRIKFEVAKNGQKVTIAQKREGEAKFSKRKTFSLKDVREKTSKISYTYTDETVGKRKDVGNYGCTVYNALRKLLA